MQTFARNPKSTQFQLSKILNFQPHKIYHPKVSKKFRGFRITPKKFIACNAKSMIKETAGVYSSRPYYYNNVLYSTTVVHLLRSCYINHPCIDDHRQEKREATRLGKLQSHTEA